ncbi:MAG: N-acetyltransferase family protein [Pseudomonadota bacterium]
MTATHPELGTPAATVRDATDADIPAIHAIYAHEVLHGLATFEEVPPPVDELLARRQTVLDQGLPYLAAHLDGRLVGYSYASAYRARPAYRNTLEDSIYVAHGMQGRGIGGTLLSALIKRCEMGPWRQMLAIAANGEQTGSIALHEKHGFRRVGHLEAVGFKHGRWLDTVLMQRALGVGSSTLPSHSSGAPPTSD